MYLQQDKYKRRSLSLLISRRQLHRFMRGFDSSSNSWEEKEQVHLPKHQVTSLNFSVISNQLGTFFCMRNVYLSLRTLKIVKLLLFTCVVGSFEAFEFKHGGFVQMHISPQAVYSALCSKVRSFWELRNLWQTGWFSSISDLFSNFGFKGNDEDDDTAANPTEGDDWVFKAKQLSYVLPPH